MLIDRSERDASIETDGSADHDAAGADGFAPTWVVEHLVERQRKPLAHREAQTITTDASRSREQHRRGAHEREPEVRHAEAASELGA